MMYLTILVILFPFAATLPLIWTKAKARGNVVYIAAIIEIVLGLLLAILWFVNGCNHVAFFVNTGIVDSIMLLGEFFLMGLIIWQCIKHKKYLIMLLSIVQTLAVAWVDLFGIEVEEGYHLVLDRLSILMILIVTVIGGLICIYAVGYMQRYHLHHTHFLERKSFFFSMLFVFIGAMCGLVLSENMNWMYFFWEITSVISFLLIGYSQTEEAIHNSFRALWMNLLGGLGFCGAIIYARITFGTADIFQLVSLDAGMIIVPIALLAFAGLTKSAQMPFSTWLLGAMVAPTPSSALLHSATMVKAGVYLLLRIAPAMHGQIPGTMVAYIGAFTFLAASILAISQRDAKKVLAYSTVSNLGLITCCAGIGTEDTVCAAVLLIIFHAASKSMLFQCVGAIENSTGNRDIEWMRGLASRLPKLAIIMVVGICGMYLAPFGMLISKWAALKAFVDSENVLLVLTIAFGSATTMFYWTKWLAKILSIQRKGTEKDYTLKPQYASMFIHAGMVILFCALLYPIMVGYIQPMIAEMFRRPAQLIGTYELVIMTVVLTLIFILPFIMYAILRPLKKQPVISYMAGINVGDNVSFVNSFGEHQQMYLSNWYLEDMFGEKKLLLPFQIIAAVIIIIEFCLTGGAL